MDEDGAEGEMVDKLAVKQKIKDRERCTSHPLQSLTTTKKKKVMKAA